VMATATEICFEGSRRLRSQRRAAGDGRICGAVYLPLASTVPHPPLQAGQRGSSATAVSGWPLLVTVA